MKLVNKPDLKVNVVVEDLGGSTDVSPTEVVYLTIYREGEMFSVDATFKIATVFGLKSAKRVEGGIYQIVVTEYDPENEHPIHDVVYRIDAQKAVIDSGKVFCSDFDCPEAENFQSSVTVSRK